MFRHQAQTGLRVFSLTMETIARFMSSLSEMGPKIPADARCDSARPADTIPKSCVGALLGKLQVTCTGQPTHHADSDNASGLFALPQRPPMNGARLDITASVVVVDDKTANGNAYGQAVAAGEANEAVVGNLDDVSDEESLCSEPWFPEEVSDEDAESVPLSPDEVRVFEIVQAERRLERMHEESEVCSDCMASIIVAELAAEVAWEAAVDFVFESCWELLGRDDKETKLPVRLHWAMQVFWVAKSIECGGITPLMRLVGKIRIRIRIEDRLIQGLLGGGESEEDAALLRQLLQCRDADLNARDHDGETAVIKAVRSGSYKYLRVLLRAKGLNVNTKNSAGLSALMIAASETRPTCLQLLLEHPSLDVGATDLNGETALMKAELAAAQRDQQYPLLCAKIIRALRSSRVRWKQVRHAVMVRPYVLHWLRYVQERQYHPPTEMFPGGPGFVREVETWRSYSLA